jgi:hypothetical protein
VVAAALQGRQVGRVDHPGLLNDQAGVAQLRRDRGPVDAEVGWPKDGPEVVAVLTQPLGDRGGFGEELVGPGAVAPEAVNLCETG